MNVVYFINLQLTASRVCHYQGLGRNIEIVFSSISMLYCHSINLECPASIASTLFNDVTYKNVSLPNLLSSTSLYVFFHRPQSLRFLKGRHVRCRQMTSDHREVFAPGYK